MIGRLSLRTWGLFAAGMLPLALAGCPWETSGGTIPEGDPALVPFESRAALLEYFKEQASQSVQQRNAPFPFFGFGILGLPMAAAPPESGDLADAGAADGDASETTPFTTTNIQEVGVDESDVVKSDGTYFYIARGESLRVVRAAPASELAEVGRLDLDVHVSEMYLYGSKLILLAQRYEAYGGGWGRPEIAIWPPYFVGSDLIVVELDVSDPAAPTVARQIELDGSLVDSRLTNGRLILVLTIAPELPANPTPLAIGRMTLDDVMPKVRARETERDMVPWENCLYPESPDGYFLTAVVTLDADDVEQIVHSVAVMANAGTIYASREALYTSDAEYDPDNNYREMTAIHKFAFDENGAAQYVASGSVPGRLLNQFSLGEYEGHLRVATHVTNLRFFGFFAGPDVAVSSAQDIAPPAEFNAIYVLGEAGGELEVTGWIENIAPGETLHSARFLGDHGFLVTFRKVDPLFVLDLRDPTDPQVVGELKVPGFSDYLHPLDDTHLIGVGKATLPTDEGFDWFQGVQISLFDVSDWSNPTAVQQITLGGRGSESEVDYTHKAFTFLPQENLLAIPMTLTTESGIPWDYGEPIFGGVVAFRVDKTSGFTELGRLEDVSWRNGDYYYGYYDGWRRAAFIGDVLYAITPDGVRTAPISDFADTTALELEE
ncbi:MAG: beta-propeller domain-containing protein [Phycisphaerae bacterium]